MCSVRYITLKDRCFCEFSQKVGDGGTRFYREYLHLTLAQLGKIAIALPPPAVFWEQQNEFDDSNF